MGKVLEAYLETNLRDLTPPFTYQPVCGFKAALDEPFPGARERYIS